jgi:hypothetical protein
MAPRTVNANGLLVGWTWSAVLAGVFTSLVVQILLTMLGFGVGMLSVDVATANEAPRTTGHLAFAWWAVSGVIAAFAGGAVAAANTPDQTDSGRVGAALAAWMVAIVAVVGASALTAGSAAGVVSNLGGPAYAAVARIDNLRAPARTPAGQVVARATPAEIEAARKHFAYVMLASFAALLCGGFAAYGAGMAVTPRVSRQIADAVT